ncbi:MAG TPA: hypothetical protein VEI99_02425 [Terriglobales bacterium]|nr:hypothetical protein [Terriglobales bacterium]
MNTTRITRYLLTAVLIVACSAVGSAQVFLSVNFGPPALPVYPQPVCPSEGYIWTPGYWAWGPYGYYWVPGTWVPAPQPSLLWTPGYWAYGGGLYYWHPGYWGPVVGFYGGIPYGYGYTGAGYYGGYWRENHFYYNQTVNNVNVTNVHNVYNTTVINNSTNVTRASYNGGPGGIVAHPTPEQEAAAQQRHVEPTPLQIQHENAAKENPQLRASVNEGRPSIAATARPADFSEHGVVAATQVGAPYRAPENRATSAIDAARPGNNARPEAEGSNAASPRNYVPRPPSSAGRDSEPRPEAAPSAEGTSREAGAPRSIPRPPSSYQSGSSSRVGTMPDAATPHPDKTPREENVPRPGNAPRPEPSQPRETSTHPENASRPSSGSRPQSGSPSQPAAQHEAAPHPQAAPRPESAPQDRHENPPQR